MHMQHSAHFGTPGRGVKFVFEEGRTVSRNGLAFDDVCVVECQVHSELTMLVPMKPGKKFNATAGTFVFHRLNRHLL